VDVIYLLSTVIRPYRADRFFNAFSGVFGRFANLVGISKLDIKCSPFHLELPVKYHVIVSKHLASLQHSPANMYLLSVLETILYKNDVYRAQDFADCIVLEFL